MAACWKLTSTGGSLVFSWPDIQLIVTLFPSTQKNALDSTLLVFQSSSLNSAKAGSKQATAMAHDDSLIWHKT
jgi:hypothetical protein